MAENYKRLYECMKEMVEKYQDEIVPGLREQLEKRVEVVLCRECKHYWAPDADFYDSFCERNGGLVGSTDESYCFYGERKDND